MMNTIETELLQEFEKTLENPVYYTDYFDHYLRNVLSKAPRLLPVIVQRIFQECPLDMRIITLWTLNQKLNREEYEELREEVFENNGHFVFDTLEEYVQVKKREYDDAFFKQGVIEEVKSTVRLLSSLAYCEYILLSSFGMEILKQYCDNMSQQDAVRAFNTPMSTVFLGWGRSLPSNEREKQWLTLFHLGGYLYASEGMNDTSSKISMEIPILV